MFPGDSLSDAFARLDIEAAGGTNSDPAGPSTGMDAGGKRCLDNVTCLEALDPFLPC
jgi:hypothetical protein